MARKLAIIGYGGIGEWHHNNFRRHFPELETVGAFDIREEAGKKASENGLCVYSSMESLLDNPEIDIVLVSTPNDTHKDISIAALKAGKNVVSEKPANLNAGELEEVIAAAKESGKLFSVHHNRRWDKDFKIIKKIIEDNTIGAPYYLESRVQGSRRSMHGWRGYAVNGGGMILDWGSHMLDQLLFLIDSPVVSVDAHVFKVFSKEVDDNFKALLRFENGISALVEVATNCFLIQPRWHICCENGTAIIHDFEGEGEIKNLVSDAEMEWEDEIVYTAAGPTRMMAPRPQHTVGTLPLPEIAEGEYCDWSICNSPYFENIMQVLDGKADLIVKPEQALRVMKLIDLIFHCAKQGHGESCRI
jgi:predicted dehydrogenase